MGTPTGGAFFNHDHVFHLRHLLLEASLLQDIVRRAWRHVYAGFAPDCNRSRLGRMLELAMISFHSHLRPTVIFDQRHQFFDLHGPRMSHMAF